MLKLMNFFCVFVKQKTTYKKEDFLKLCCDTFYTLRVETFIYSGEEALASNQGWRF